MARRWRISFSRRTASFSLSVIRSLQKMGRWPFDSAHTQTSIALSLRYPRHRLEGAIASHAKVLVPPPYDARREAPAPQGKTKRVPDRYYQQVRSRRARFAHGGVQQEPRRSRDPKHGERRERAAGEQTPESRHRYAESNERKRMADGTDCTNRPQPTQLVPQEFVQITRAYIRIDDDLREYRAKSDSACQLSQSIIIGQLIGYRHETADAIQHLSADRNRRAESERSGARHRRDPHRRYKPFIDEQAA